mmetsp:Transcript_17469/g.32859  ORF Transcript_17469/g.32859 Transcript_17469/m.32859 type:complete len:568 (-) Transcript_17469:10-1713(-)
MALLRAIGALIAVAGAAASGGDQVDLSEECVESECAAGFLQESVRVGSRTSADLTLISAQEGPLTAEVRPEDFPEFSVPVGPRTFCLLVLAVVLLAAHEFYVNTGHAPLLSDEEHSNTLAFQLAYMAGRLLIFVESSLVIPLSLDYTLASGGTATVSGAFISSGTVFAILGLFAGRPMANEANWDQRRVRALLVWCNILTVVVYLALGVLTQRAAHWDLPAKRRNFWFVFFLNGTTNFITSLPLIAWSVMWNQITPAKEKTFWTIMIQCSRNGGFILGPILFALISFLVRQGREVSPISMMGWSFIGLAFCGVANSAFLAFVTPATLHRPPPDEGGAKSPQKQGGDLRVEELPSEDRARVVWNMIWFAVERPFSLGAIEVATIMLLEVSYGWSPEICGASFLVIAGASILLTAGSYQLLGQRLATESSVFLGAALLGLCSVVLLFDFKFFGAGSLLMADSLLYGGASVANGIAEGWGARAAEKGTSHSIEIYRQWMFLAIHVSRFLSPIVARVLIDYGGRNLYATLQLIVIGMGTSRVYRTCLLVWPQHKAQGYGDDFKNQVPEELK